MSVLEVELAVLIVVLVVGLVLMVVGHRGLTERLYDRQKTLDVHIKAVTRHALTTVDKEDETVGTAQHMLDDSRQLLQQVEAHLSDPDLRRLLGRG